MANHYHPIFGQLVRVEHWQNAIHQTRAAARSMLDKREPYRDIHWFWSDQYDYNVQYAGFHRQWDELIVRGRPDEYNVVAFYMQDSRILAAVAINRGKDILRAISLIKADLRSLLPRARPLRTRPQS